jgi:hypothetical protein
LTGFGAGFLETLFPFAAFFATFLRGAGLLVFSFLRFSFGAAFFAFLAFLVLAM